LKVLSIVSCWLRPVSFVLALSVAVTLAAQSPRLGRIVFPTSGSAQAQPAFMRGVLLLHSFEYDDAIASFHEAQRLDPAFALAYWGEAMCFNQTLWFNENVEKARGALARLAPTRAARQAKAPTPREKGYLDAVERLFGDGDKTARNRAYADRMAELTRQFPEDDEAALFYALALLGTIGEGQRDPVASQKAGSIATAILKKNPEHPGAAHYALHAFDDGEHAAMGLEAARIYARIAPASSHARHMPSHVFLPLGMWDEATASDESAFAASVARVKRLGLSMAQADFHSLSWLHYEYLQQGRLGKAREVMKTVEDALRFGSAALSGPRGGPERPALQALGEHQHAESEIGRGFSSTSLKSELGSMRARLVVDAGAWSDMRGQGNFENIDELFALGYAAVRLGDSARGTAAAEQLRTAMSQVGDTDAKEIAGISSIALQGVLRMAANDRAAGLKALAAAAGVEAKRPKPIARPYPIKPAVELYADALLQSGDAAGAVAQFKASLARTPRRAASLLGLARAAAKAGMKAESVKAAKDFLAAWHLADTGRPELAEAKQLAAASEQRQPRKHDDTKKK
jgi:tetratricopeptide (TPR) repeat protein